MPTKSKSNLKVFLRKTKREMSVLVWQTVGYHGKEGSVAQVTWRGAEGIQILFEGEGFRDAGLNVAIDNIIVTTENCSLRPYFAEPDHRCSDKQFTCKNGECVKKNLRCDGDFACKDESDEDDCECPSSMFTCQGGKCLPATDVCDGKNDCSYGDDENNCRNPCHSRYQCVDGSCISWSNTCRQTSFCRDGTSTPSVCGSGKCHLNNLACNSTEHARCKSFRGHCSFQTGQCGLKPDRNATFYWTVGSGQTPTEKTGPSYDHSTFSKDGSYIFIEASQRNPGDEARLLSDEIEPSEAVCVQFWYHMHGLHVGSLSIYLKNNQSETLVWRLSGDQGNRWRFGQMALNSTSLYTFVIEGTVGNGSRGDIAVDDLTVVDGDCQEIIKQASPDCDFEESMCDWDAQQGWVLTTRIEAFETSGGFVASLPAGASDLPSTLSSPVINIHDYEWKCLRFWYFIGTKDARDWHTASLMVLLRTSTSNQVTLLFFADDVTHKAQYTQMPLSRNSTNSKIYFVGFNGRQFLAIDDVSFTKEPCKQIPWKQNEECQKDLGMENGEISDRQITASSQLDASHAATQGRLNLKATGNKAGSWSALSNDPSQWLQKACII
ncbi:MAM and LDL-receptor class A domain-containing protein 1-like [Orbicella faveolata]|uniref:MAM and LDL-receptor class A domain-containing protein 1-like n=1 Tax=Orbicella faveolata TaxID=48498 RepID=UPI0009E4907E|nr:MAM and LDL-receptor class A domain-containing protein 1-like [Orbicella faveolata]